MHNRLVDPICSPQGVTEVSANHTEAEVDYALCSFASQFVSWDRNPSKMAVEETGALIIGETLTEPDAPEMMTYGCQVVQWLANMAIAKFMMPQLCGAGEKEMEQVMAAKAIGMLADICSSNGTIFTSSPPKSAKMDVCVDYPAEEAKVCTALGHSHLVSGAFADTNFAAVREADVELAIRKGFNHELMRNLRDLSPICEGVFKDALCLDAFPSCRLEERTPCQMVCRNLQVCMKEVFYSGKPDFEYEEIRKECSAVCLKSGQLDKEVDTKKLLSNVEDPMDMLSPEKPTTTAASEESKYEATSDEEKTVQMAPNLVAQIAGGGAFVMGLSLILGSAVVVIRRGVLRREPSTIRWLQRGDSNSYIQSGSEEACNPLSSSEDEADDMDVGMGEVAKNDPLLTPRVSLLKSALMEA